MLFRTEKWLMFTWSRSLPFMIPSTLIRAQQTHRHLAKSQSLNQSASEESLITVSGTSSSIPGVSWRLQCDSSIRTPYTGKERVTDPKGHWYAGVFTYFGWTLSEFSVSFFFLRCAVDSEIQAESWLYHEDLWVISWPKCDGVWNNPGPDIHHAGVWRSTCSACTNRYVSNLCSTDSLPSYWLKIASMNSVDKPRWLKTLLTRLWLVWMLSCENLHGLLNKLT